VPVTRFAPSPTGHLHLGHIVNALFVWGVARARSGRVRLRIEDHDRERSQLDFERSILEDLEWLGLEPDEPALASFRDGWCDGRQSDHLQRYDEALNRLTRAGITYWCDCSRQRILRDGGGGSGELRYDGRCRLRGLGPGPDRGVRARMDPGDEQFTDEYLGAQVQTPAAQCGDLLVHDRRGNWTYQFAVTVDDAAEGIDLVIRGADLLDSTGRQIRLARLLGRTEPPTFLHHPLITDDTGRKLSKSMGDTGVRELRAAGVSPAEVLGRAAAAVGLVPVARPVTVDELGNLTHVALRRQ
jgi:glutamyl/glutaminyl-tRNA synthetase